MTIYSQYSHDLDRYVLASPQDRHQEAVRYEDAQRRALDAGDDQLAADIGKLNEANGEGYRAVRENDAANRAGINDRPAARAEALAKADEHAGRYGDLRREVSEGPNGSHRMMLAEAVVAGRDIDDARFDLVDVSKQIEARDWTPEETSDEQARDERVRETVAQMRGDIRRSSSSNDVDRQHGQDHPQNTAQDRQEALARRADEAKEAGRPDLERVFRNTSKSENLERNENKVRSEDLYHHRSLGDEGLPSRHAQWSKAHQDRDESEQARDDLAHEKPELRAEAESYVNSDRKIEPRKAEAKEAATAEQGAAKEDTRTEAVKPRAFRSQQHAQAWDARHVEKPSRFDGPPQRTEGQQATADGYHRDKAASDEKKQIEQNTTFQAKPRPEDDHRQRGPRL